MHNFNGFLLTGSQHCLWVFDESINSEFLDFLRLLSDRSELNFSCSLDRQQKKIKQKVWKNKKGVPHLSHTQELERWKGREMLGATGYESLSNGVSYEKTSVNFLSDLQQSPTQSSHSVALWSLSLTESCHCVLPSMLCSLTLLLLISNIFPWNLILLPVLRLERCADGPRVRRWGRGRPLNTRSPLCVASQLWPTLFPPAQGNCWGHVWLPRAWSEVWDYTEGSEHLVYGFLQILDSVGWGLKPCADVCPWDNWGFLHCWINKTFQSIESEIINILISLETHQQTVLCTN